ncbi:hypothetical protein [Natronobacterium texcoconense]|uniref:Uncharacterized protein n=1 Tax=Natronobacterium texcoconense TaxID=1095778 RepID=A0A1H1G9J6_NATTX|nr:hypothetical protein [Natronobacterium texcoconense]SDR09867.1 hypothetical protein SAMN04489842_2328 [Natronobacterium texcoconense]
MDTNPSRRRLLQLGGVGATASLAGCSQFDISDDESADPETESELEVGEEPDIDPEDGFTALVQPDQDELQALEMEIMEAVEAGELSQMEAQEEFQQRQAELTAERAVAFEDDVAGDDDLSIEAGIADIGAFLLDGPDERLLDTLRDSEVNGLVPGEEYAQMLEQQQAETVPVPEEDPDADPDDD